MKGMKRVFYQFSMAVLALSSLWLWSSCNTEQDSTAAYGEDDDYAQVEAVDLSQPTTRAIGMDLSTFSLSVFYTRTNKLLANNIKHTMTTAGVQMAGSWRMQPSGEMVAVAVSPSLDAVDNLVLTKDEQSFEYTVPPTEQTMIKIGGDLSFTKASTSNKLSLKFVNALTQFTLRARNEMKVEFDGDENQYDTEIYVKGFTIHNLAAKGRFNFTGDYNGKWTLIDDVYANYSQELQTPVKLSKTTFVDVIDSVLILMPQTPVVWKPAASASAIASVDGIEKADEDHKCYIELRCAITVERNSQTTYIWGTENTYKSVYLPYVTKYCPKPWNVINRQGTYNLRFIKTEALDSEGKPIKPEIAGDENGTFENAVFIEVAPTDDSDNDNVDDWEDMELDPYDVTI